jgi:hypothetical protein
LQAWELSFDELSGMKKISVKDADRGEFLGHRNCASWILIERSHSSYLSSSCEEKSLMRISSDRESIQLTLGDLVVAVTDAAMELSRDEKAAYRIASMTLNKMRLRSLSEDETGKLDSPGKLPIH